ncbi:MAG TPA: MFS transporter [Kofleriaceae bacterium]|nr:MFS transporter [Kofleriaceae bacterium]
MSRPALPRAYWFVWAGTLINRLGGFVVPLLAIYLVRARGLDAEQAGGIVAAFGAGQVVASIAGGQLTDRLGRRATMLISLWGGAVAMLALGRARGTLELTCGVAAVGFVGELYRPAVAALISDVVAPAHRVYAFGALYWAVNLGWACAGALGGLVADYDFSLLFYADAATTFAFGVVVALAVPETRPAPEPRATAGPAPALLGDRAFLVFLAIHFASVLVFMQVLATLAIHMSWQGFAPSTYGVVVALNGVLICVLQPVLTPIAARRDPSRVLALAALLYGIAMFAHGLAPTALAHAGAVVIWTLAEILESPTKSALVAAFAPTSARGRYQGAMVMTWGLGTMVGPKLGTWIWQHAGPHVLWTGCLVVGAIASALYLVTARARRSRLGHATPP